MSHPAERLRAQAVHGLLRLRAGFGHPIVAPVDQPEIVLEYLQTLLTGGDKPLINVSPSAAVRLSEAAIQRGVDLKGVSALLAAEPVTPERRAAIEAGGIEAWPTYGTSETNACAVQFRGAREPDEVHLFEDAFAAIPRIDGVSVPTPFLLTGLRTAGPKVLINAEIGDEALIDAAPAGAACRDYGYRTRLRSIRSIRKITAFGATIAVADLYSVVESDLPRVFGGGSTHYQVLEDEAPDGSARITLRIDPRLGALDEQRVREVFWRAVAAKRSYYGFMTRTLNQAGALWIERSAPKISSRGKMLPVIPVRSQGARSREKIA